MSGKILIVEDAQVLVTLLKELFTSHDFEVVGVAKNGNEALDLYKKLFPDLVTMDIVMPDIDGLEGIKKILDYDPQAKIIVISAMGQNLLVERAIKIGAKGYIMKPYDPDKVIEIVRQVLKSN